MGGSYAPGPAALRVGPARLLIVGAAMLWGTTGTAQALGPDGASPATVGAVRILLGGAVLGAVALGVGGPQALRGWLRPGRRGATLAGVLAVAAYQASFFSAVAITGVAVGTIVGIGSAPAFTGLIAFALTRERPERRWGAATALGVAGTVLLVLPGAQAGVRPAGIALALGAGASYAVYTVAAKRLLSSGADTVGTMAALFAGGGLLLTPVLAVHGAGWVLSMDGALMALWLGVAATGVSYLLFGRGLSRLPAPTVATLSLAEPLTAGALGALVLVERPGPVAAAGAALILAGLALLAVRPATAPAR